MAEKDEKMGEAPFHPGTVLRRTEHQASCDIGEEAVILDLRGGVYYGLAEVGARVWELLEDDVAVAALKDALLEEFEVDPATCERELTALLRDLLARGLVEVRHGQDR